MISLITKPAPGGNVYRVFRTTDSMALTEAALLKKNRFRGCPGTSRGMLFQCRTDRNRTMEFIAPGTASFTGHSEEDILGGKTHYGSTIHELDRELVLKSIQDSLKNGNDYSITYRVRRDSGRILWVMEQGRASGRERTAWILRRLRCGHYRNHGKGGAGKQRQGKDRKPPLRGRRPSEKPFRRGDIQNMRPGRFVNTGRRVQLHFPEGRRQDENSGIRRP